MKKIISLLLSVIMVLALFTACGKQQTAATETAAAQTEAAAAPAETAEQTAEPVPEDREFTDDCGRTVTVPAEITKIAVSGPLAQIYILPIASDLMVGYANEFSEDAQKYINPDFLALPALGQLYGGKGTMDLEALLAAAPEVVIDVGEQKGSIVEDLDGLTEQTGIPFVHVDATVATSGDTYRRLGELLGREQKGEELAAYLEGIYSEITAIMEKVDADGARKTIVYCLGDKGLNVLAQGSYHAETLNILAQNAAELADVVSSGAGNEIDMEQLLLWNPEFIVFAPDSVFEEVGSDAAWLQLDAIKNGNYVETPFGPYGWLQSPPAVQRYLGMLWLCSILYPDYCDYDLQEEVTEYYKIFYDYDLSDAGYQELTANALLPKS